MRREDQATSRKSALPTWLNSQTIALLGGMIALGALSQNGFHSMRTELKGDIAELRTELKGDIAELRTDLRRLEDRTRAVEVAVTGMNVRLDNLEQVVAGINVRLDNLERVVGGVRGLAEGADLSACDRAACERLACETPPCKGDPPADASPT